jgi:hypothetical protein
VSAVRSCYTTYQLCLRLPSAFVVFIFVVYEVSYRVYHPVDRRVKVIRMQKFARPYQQGSKT